MTLVIIGRRGRDKAPGIFSIFVRVVFVLVKKIPQENLQ